MRKPSMKQAEWIAKRISTGETADDIYDVLLGYITKPASFIIEVEDWANEYELDFRRHNVG